MRAYTRQMTALQPMSRTQARTPRRASCITVVGAQQQEAAEELAREWERPTVTLQPNETGDVEPSEPVGIDDPMVLAAPANNAKFANRIVPRLGVDYRRPITEGVGYNALNDSRAGIGHDPHTQMPGDFGHFALAAHRTTYGRSFHNVNERFITLTSCNPSFSSAERVISYGVFDADFPREGAAPLEIAGLVQATGA